MPTITKITAVWTGFAGGPGYSNFYLDGEATAAEATSAAAALRTMFNGLIGYLPNNLTIRPTGVAQYLDLGSGVMTGQTAYTQPLQVTGTNTTAYSGLSGASIRWVTGAVINGRALSGRTFLVPMVGIYDTDGTLAPAFVTTLTTLANAYAHYVASSDPAATVVWHRPIAGVGGAAATMSGAIVPDKAVGLRSRRG